MIFAKIHIISSKIEKLILVIKWLNLITNKMGYLSKLIEE